jgi:hypothetical protein
MAVLVALQLPDSTVTANTCLAKQPDCPSSSRSMQAASGLREAVPGEIWITRPDITLDPTRPRLRPAAVLTDTTPPAAPTGLTATAELFGVNAAWQPAGPHSFVYAIGTGSTESTEADLRWWQSTATDTRIRSALPLTAGMQVYVAVRAVNAAGVYSPIVRAGPLSVRALTVGEPSNTLTYTLALSGLLPNGNPGPGFEPAFATSLNDFLRRMLPVLRDLYGPPSVSYRVRIVRNQRMVNSAIFYPETDEIHVGDSVTYQLLTHELVHAWRNDRLLSSDSVWAYDVTLSAFEEGFAQAVAYAAMTEFARRHADFPLASRIYFSSHEWDYDFQNIPQLATHDFWSDSGGTRLYWVRYEMAAAAMAKIERTRPGFYRAFNTEYYRQLNATPTVTATRALIVDIIASLVPSVEGVPTRAWIDRQHVLAAQVTPGPKAYQNVQHYPGPEYYLFTRVWNYDTFTNGSDWARPDGAGGWLYYNRNGSTGLSTLRNATGQVVATRTLQISPTVNPPTLFAFGRDTLDVSTAASHMPWPGGDGRNFITNVLPLQLYRMETRFVSASRDVSHTQYAVIGQPLRATTGVWGGVIGANTGVISLTHSAVTGTLVLSVTHGAFWGKPVWSSIPNPATNSIDTLPGTVYVTLTLPSGVTYVDARTFDLGSWNGNQAFLFDVNQMRRIWAPGSRRVFMPALYQER